MTDGLSIFSGISTAFHLSKSISQFVRDVKDATRASLVLINLVGDDIDNLEAYEKVLKTNKHLLSPDQRDRLRRLNARMGKTHDDLRQKLQRYRDANLKDKLSWSAHGVSLQKDEETLRSWISRLHDCLADFGFFAYAAAGGSVSSSKATANDRSRTSAMPPISRVSSCATLSDASVNAVYTIRHAMTDSPVPSPAVVIDRNRRRRRN